MAEYEQIKTEVLVIGGGPAGMEAARVSAIRGHDVTLYEKSHRLGGLLPLAAMVKGAHPEDLNSLIDYHARQIKKLGVKIELGKEADPAVVERLKPDLIILDLYFRGEIRWDLLLEMKAFHPQVPVLIFTGCFPPEDLRVHFADAWVRKSLTFMELKQKITPLLDGFKEPEPVREIASAPLANEWFRRHISWRDSLA